MDKRGRPLNLSSATTCKRVSLITSLPFITIKSWSSVIEIHPVSFLRKPYTAKLKNFLDALKQCGVAKVSWGKVNIHLLSDNVALASNLAVRYSAQGDVIEKVDATNRLHRYNKQRKIAVFSVHSAKIWSVLAVCNRFLLLSNLAPPSLMSCLVKLSTRLLKNYLRGFSLAKTVSPTFFNSLLAILYQYPWNLLAIDSGNSQPVLR